MYYDLIGYSRPVLPISRYLYHVLTWWDWWGCSIPSARLPIKNMILSSSTALCTSQSLSQYFGLAQFFKSIEPLLFNLTKTKVSVSSQSLVEVFDFFEALLAYFIWNSWCFIVRSFQKNILNQSWCYVSVLLSLDHFFDICSATIHIEIGPSSLLVHFIQDRNALQ